MQMEQLRKDMMAAMKARDKERKDAISSLLCSLELISSRIASLFSMNLSRLFHCSVIKVLCLLS